MKTRIIEIWQQLATMDHLEKGLVKTMLEPSIKVPIYLALLFPSGKKALMIGFPKNTSILTEPFAGKGMNLELVEADENNIGGYLMLTLNDKSFSEVFDVFLEDSLNSIATSISQNECIKIFIERLSCWRKMLEIYEDSGLTPLAQQGLFGELVVALRLININPEKAREIIESWQGPDKFRQDFQYSDWAIEVKTTIDVDTITIANETQLSTSGLKHLFLWHLVLDKYKSQGVTLNDLIAELKKKLVNQKAASDLFNIRLAASGYHSHQSALYEGLGYFIRQETKYRVDKDFPSLTTQTIPAGITEVSYTLSLSSCNTFIIHEETMWTQLKL
jgi:Putative  PD-(D/E)XK family member, (DUF4420)